MLLLADLTLYVLGTLGHVAVCVSALNRVQGSVADHAVEKALKLGICGWSLTGLCLPFVLMLGIDEPEMPWEIVAGQLHTTWGYFTLATAWLVITALKRVVQILSDRCPSVWQQLDSKILRLDRELGDCFVRESERSFWVSIVGNEVGHLDVNRKALKLKQLPKQLEGLTITHFSDLHITGAIIRPYFERLKEEIQQLDSDLVIVSGDILDDKTKLAWVTDLVSELNSRVGCFFVLGNHDVRNGQGKELRDEIERCGWQDLGGRALSLEIEGQQVILAGNELPWIGEPPLSNSVKSAFSICAVHTPDQFRWGRQQGYDLMLAGHAHGGQIRLPLIGPVVCPSVHGVRYASGVFSSGQTLLHVSRGVSGLQPLRWRCRPELTQLVLSCDES
ncbi:MAG: hypothetical protein CMJ76_02610 [Planctomycetaceae bacterium]|nr:hypothetical protein [Planctomycetaceae bacterium]|tara:strand:+ start:396 stop:1565 length:1170 start_codon:yes stop_codon:yes gene_type:complete